MFHWNATRGLTFGLALWITACSSSAPTRSTGASSGSMATTPGSTSGSAASGTAGGSTSTTGTSGSSTRSGMTAASTSAFSEASHTPFPLLASVGGPILAAPEIVAITYQGFPFDDTLDDAGPTLTQWLPQFTGEYGVQAATYQRVVLPTTAPPSVDGTTDTPRLLWSLILDGGLPLNADGGVDGMLYMVFYPPTTDETFTQSNSSCANAGNQYTAAFHRSSQEGAASLAYAVVPTCPQEPADGLTWFWGHESAEGATDPYFPTAPAYTFNPTLAVSSNPWAAQGGEIADLCEEFSQGVRLNGVYLPLLWSNRAAADGGAPCVPWSGPFFNVAATPTGAQTLAPGQSMTFQLTGWSTTPVPDWQFAAYNAYGTQPLQLSLSSQTLNNGQTATLTVTMPAGTSQPAVQFIEIFSGPEAFWDLSIIPP